MTYQFPAFAVETRYGIQSIY